MRPTLIRYARVKNLGNFENERAEVEFTVEEGDDESEVFDAARDFVCWKLGIEHIKAKKISEDGRTSTVMITPQKSGDLRSPGLEARRA